MTRLAVALILTGLTLSACQEDDKTATNDTPAVSDEARCAIESITPLIGESQSALEGLDIPEPFRIVLPGMALTMDHNPKRTNIDIDDAGQIKRVWCG
ncbi:I78 family peptidase inhibitor [Celeribacter sp. ULVN23_4]